MSQDGVTLYSPLRGDCDWRALAQFIRDPGGTIHGPMQAALANGVSGLHFLSIFVIEPRDGNPAALCLEANFDGSRADFLAGLIAASAPLLHQIYACCTGYPGTSDGALRAYLERADAGYRLFYVGCAGRTTAQIQEESELAGRIAASAGALERRRSRRRALVREIWDGLNRADRDAVVRVPRRPRWVRLALYERPLAALYRGLQWLFFLIGVPTFILVAAQAAGSPVWPAVAPPPWVAIAMGYWAKFLLSIAAVVTLGWALLFAWEFPAELTLRAKVYVVAAKAFEYLWAALCAIPGFIALLGLLAFLHWHQRLVLHAFGILLGLLVAALVLYVPYWVWLARIASRELDDRVDDIAWNPPQLAQVSAREDDLLQNHFVSVTMVRPGALRMGTLRAVLFATHWLARILHNPRGLFNTQSIHFARWALLPGRRLLFVSNYDGSFGGYLGIFATLAAGGVSAIWGNTEGFPRTFLLFGDGARDEQRFKARARASQVETLLWYRRYPDLTVAAIERNASLRETLARFSSSGGTMSEAELDAFLRSFAVARP